MAVYDRAIEAVEPVERFGLFNIYLKKAADIYGVTRTRQIYEKAIEVLSDSEAKEMCLRYEGIGRSLLNISLFSKVLKELKTFSFISKYSFLYKYIYLSIFL